MKYKYLTLDEQDDVIASALVAREKEFFHYDHNRVTYLRILDQLKDLPAEWPEELRKFRGLGREQLAAVVTNEAEFTLAFRLQYRDRVRHLLNTTIVEMHTVETTYLALEQSLPEGERRDAAIQRALTKEPATPLKLQLRQVMGMLTDALTQRREIGQHESNGVARSFKTLE